MHFAKKKCTLAQKCALYPVRSALKTAILAQFGPIGKKKRECIRVHKSAQFWGKVHFSDK